MDNTKLLGDTETIKAFLESTVDSGQLEELKKASSLVEASNVDKKPDCNQTYERFCQSTIAIKEKTCRQETFAGKGGY